MITCNCNSIVRYYKGNFENDRMSARSWATQSAQTTNNEIAAYMANNLVACLWSNQPVS